MSWSMRESSRATREASGNGIVRRMVNLPRSIVGGLSRVMGYGTGRIGIGGRRGQNPAANIQLHPPQEPVISPEEWDFLASFEQQYGSTHPFFYACQFMEALKIAEDEQKFMFMYLHSPQHPFTPSFCRETLRSELIVQFLDANFVSWGALDDREEGLQMAATLQPTSFPCCALISPAAGDSIAVLQQIEGPVSPAELVEILQRTVEEQGLAFRKPRAKEEEMIKARAMEEERKIARAKEEERIRADRRVREEQDASYLAALKIDKEKEMLNSLFPERKVQKPADSSAKPNHEKPRNNAATQNQLCKANKEGPIIRETETAKRSNDRPQVTQILIRFPNGERREQSFSCLDSIQSVYRYINSLGVQGIDNYRLVSSFPRRVFSVDQMGMTLMDAGLHPKATIFLELL